MDKLEETETIILNIFHLEQMLLNLLCWLSSTQFKQFNSTSLQFFSSFKGFNKKALWSSLSTSLGMYYSLMQFSCHDDDALVLTPQNIT